MNIPLPVFLRQRFNRRLLRSSLFFLCSVWSIIGYAQTPLSLPFFDDFSTASGQPGIDRPDPARWQPGSGVYINNTMAINPPTINVASFDGLRANGLPYDQDNELAQGYTDTLASLPINLANLTAADAVYLSFYWQIKGLGELPDAGDSLTRLAGDSLTVQFLDVNNVWRTVWWRVGGEPNNNFFQAFIPVNDQRYFHAGFAFRFRSFGRESGPFDTWNVDYIYLNKGRSDTDRLVKDIAVRQAPTSFLKRYTAMPLTQYVVNPSAETADSVSTEIVNLNSIFNITTYRFTVRDEVSGRLIQDLPQPASVPIEGLTSQRKVVRLDPVTSLGTSTSAVLRYKFDILTTDDQFPSIPGVDLRQNDTVSARAVLDNYYAYDDGSWEYGVQIGPREQLAVRFVLNKPDVIAGIMASIVPFRLNQSGQPFVITVYSNANNRPGNAIYRQSFTMQYPPYRNGFVTFPFDRGIAVKDTFYIGYQQISVADTTFLRLGFDKNSPFGNQIFYNGGSIWEQNLRADGPLQLQGALMLRPIMGGQNNGPVTALPEPEPLRPLQAYPNPTSGVLRWESSKVTRLEVTSLSGQLVRRIEPSRGQQLLDVSDLPDGMYLLRLFEGDRQAVQRFIIHH